jgi:uncharacterized protein YjbI with pentapeptide repeats
MQYKDQTINFDQLDAQDYQDAKFVRCHLTGTLKFLSFSNCLFTDSDFADCKFDNTRFEKCAFPGSRLSYLNFASTNLTKCNFDQAMIHNSLFERKKPGDPNQKIILNLTGTSFRGANLDGTIFSKCNLAKVDFTGTSLIGTSFDKCDLQEAKFINVKLDRASFEGSKISKTQLDLGGFLQFGQSKGFVLADNS